MCYQCKSAVFIWLLVFKSAAYLRMAFQGEQVLQVYRLILPIRVRRSLFSVAMNVYGAYRATPTKERKKRMGFKAKKR